MSDQKSTANSNKVLTMSGRIPNEIWVRGILPFCFLGFLRHFWAEIPMFFSVLAARTNIILTRFRHAIF